MNEHIFRGAQKFNIDYPIEVTIETTGRCNARCLFCPHSELPRRNTEMSDALFFKIISDLKEIPSTHEFNISPFKVNEPLMDKNIFNKIKVINKELPNAGIRFFSNFNMANENHIESLSKIENLKQIWISLNEIEPDEYKRVMGMNLDRTITNIKKLLEFNSKNRIILDIVISRVADGTIKDEMFVNKLSNILKEYKNQFRIICIKRVEWIDFLEQQNAIPTEDPCMRWFEVNIICTGEVALCCMDGKCEYSIGDLNKQSVLEVYNSPWYRELREKAIARKYIEPCKKCSL